MLRFIVLAAILLTGLPGMAAAGGTAGPSQAVDRLSREYGPVLIAAVHSLEECVPVLAGEGPVEHWQGFLPEALPVGRRQADRIESRLAAFLASLDGSAQQSILQRLTHWCQLNSVLFTQMRHYRGFSLERQMGVLFSLPATRPLFEDAVAARGLRPEDVSPVRLGASLSSQEMTELVYASLDALSSLSEQQQIGFLAEYFAAWPKVNLD